jgi:hypothetical protein
LIVAVETPLRALSSASRIPSRTAVLLPDQLESSAIQFWIVELSGIRRAEAT